MFDGTSLKRSAYFIIVIHVYFILYQWIFAFAAENVLSPNCWVVNVKTHPAHFSDFPGSEQEPHQQSRGASGDLGAEQESAEKPFWLYPQDFCHSGRGQREAVWANGRGRGSKGSQVFIHPLLCFHFDCERILCGGSLMWNVFFVQVRKGEHGATQTEEDQFSSQEEQTSGLWLIDCYVSTSNDFTVNNYTSFLCPV